MTSADERRLRQAVLAVVAGQMAADDLFDLCAEVEAGLDLDGPYERGVQRRICDVREAVAPSWWRGETDDAALSGLAGPVEPDRRPAGWVENRAAAAIGAAIAG